METLGKLPPGVVSISSAAVNRIGTAWLEHLIVYKGRVSERVVFLYRHQMIQNKPPTELLWALLNKLKNNCFVKEKIQLRFRQECYSPNWPGRVSVILVFLVIIYTISFLKKTYVKQQAGLGFGREQNILYFSWSIWVLFPLPPSTLKRLHIVNWKFW